VLANRGTCLISARIFYRLWSDESVKFTELEVKSNKRSTTTRVRKRNRGEDPASKEALAKCAIELSASTKVKDNKRTQEVKASKGSGAVSSSSTKNTKHELLDTSHLEEIVNMDRAELESLLSGTAVISAPKSGESVTGTIASVGEAVLVSLRGKFEGVIDRSELTDLDGVMAQKIGDKITAVVLGWEQGVLRLSAQLKGEHVSSHIQAAADSGLPVEGKVSATVSGGFIVELGGSRAFCPISHIDRNSAAPPEAYVGEQFMFRIIELKDKDVVVSRRVILDELAEREAGESWMQMQVGQTHSGVVKNITQFGAFVEVNGIEGLVHVSEISNERVEDISKHLAPGQTVTARVLSVDPASKRLSLTLKGEDSQIEGLTTRNSKENSGGLGTLGDLFKNASGSSPDISKLLKGLE